MATSTGQYLKIVPLTPERSAPVSSVIAKAFQDDPMMVYLVPDAGKRRQALPKLLRSMVRFGHLYGTVDIADDGRGAAVWLPPGVETTPYRIARSGMMTASMGLGLGTVRRLLRLVGAMDTAHKQHMPEPHWYLWLLGVDPEAQGRGIGKALLLAGMERATSAENPMYLDTHHPANVTYYERFGFTIAEDQVVDGIHFWGMRKAAGE